MGVLAVIGARIIGVFRTDFGQVCREEAQAGNKKGIMMHTE